MATRMLIDARHPEETRVAVLKGNRIEEFDFESADRKQIKGNIYLAKVTRVEPSLQAAFVDFGGNRHGFLAFSEIHPDYYQIPKEDRAALLAEEAAHAEEEAALRAAEDDGVSGPDNDFDSDDEGDDETEESGDALADDLAGDDGVEEIDTSEEDDVSTIEGGQLDGDTAAEGDENSSDDDASQGDDQSNNARRRGRRGRRRQGRGQSKQADELRAKRMALRRRYKIQDVIQRRQVLLVQVVKEERGNKGAALTSYLSLAGRYCVLMPNSSHGGGISRKISSASDRKRLKQIVSELSLPKSMGCIVRTAGLQRTKPEIKRDFDYLARLWDEIRENTLGSSAPALIHSDSDLIKRAIRDIYNRDIEEVMVEGEYGYKAAKQFMKLLMPSHARRIKAYADPVPLFQRYGAEDQLSAMYDPVVQLKSGGYLVINPTEALVSIDINSGRSTKEHGIEQTALATNLEAAREIARQLRLRDMAGLVVIDFIDMEHGSNVRKVEKTMKDVLKNDRARIQVGRISSFGLMEMSRQRLRTGVLEATTRECPHCDGTGLVRTASSAGLSALRLIEDEAAKGKGSLISLYASTEAAIYMLNTKRSDLAEIETRYAVAVEVVPEGENEGAKMRVVSSGIRPAAVPKFEAIVDDDDDDDDIEVENEAEFEASENDGTQKRRRRRRGGRGRKRNDEQQATANDEETSKFDDPKTENGGDRNGSQQTSDEIDEDAPRKKRRRRGGRGRRRPADGNQAASDQTEQTEPAAQSDHSADEAPVIADADNTPEIVSTADVNTKLSEANADEQAPAQKPKRARRARKTPASKAKADMAAAGTTGASTPDTVADDEAAKAADTEARQKPKRTRRKKVEPVAGEASGNAAAPSSGEAGSPSDVQPVAEADPATKPKRTRRKKADDKKAPDPQTAEEPKVLEKTGADMPSPAAKAPLSPPVSTSDVNNEPAEDTGPARRGWWQRTFGN